MSKRLRLIISVLFITAVIPSCKQREASSDNIFRYNESAGIATLDPAFARNQAIMWPVHQLFNTLVETDSNLRIAPSLARSWQISDSGRVITFDLREDVFFHDDAAFPNGKGRKLVAKDVVFSFQRLIDPQTASPGAWIFNGKVDPLRPFSALNDSTFQLRLISPFQPVLGILSMPYCSIVPHEAVEKYGNDFRRHPVGTGPFMFVNWEEGQALVLKKNPHYFEKDETGKAIPYLDGIFISFYGSKATEFLEFSSGRLDFINDIDPSFKDELLTKTGNLRSSWQGKVQLKKHPYLNVEYLGMKYDSLHPFFNASLRGKAFRRAVNFAIDRRKMIFYLRNSIGIPATAGFIPPSLLSNVSVKGYEYSIDSAKKYLALSGFDPKRFLPLKLTTVPAYADLGTFIVNELSRAGIPAEVEIVQKSLLLQQMAAGQVSFFRGSWIADYPDPENYLSVFYGSNPAPPNYTRFSNASFDSLYERAVSETVDPARFSLYAKMDSIIIEEAPVVPLWYDMVIHLVNNRINGVAPNGQNMLELRKVRMKE